MSPDPVVQAAPADETPPPPPAPGEGAQQVIASQGALNPKEVVKALGPGIITGGADNDPAGITTYSVIGAQSGFSQNWLLLLSTPLLIVIQQMAARVGSVTKSDFASSIRTHYGNKLALTAVTLAVIANVLTLVSPHSSR
jgi:Mn2+/Fe2+ NRAMP family transporter